VKGPSEGISASVLAEGITNPVVVWNVHAAEVPEKYRLAHRRTMEHWSDRSQPEHEFTSFFQSEICIPLVIGGQAIGAIVGLGQPCSRERASELEGVLANWQEILTFLYYAAVTFEREEREESCLKAIRLAMPSVASSPSNERFLRKMVTVLTCDAGAGWHRAMIFAFQDQYPSDARCLMALGGIGQPGWSDAQARCASEFCTLEEYLEHAETDSFGEDDPLFGLTRDSSQPWIVPRELLVEHRVLNACFSGNTPPAAGALVAGAAVRFASDDAWLRSVPSLQPALQNLASQCDHFLIPLRWYAAANARDAGPQAIGFVLLENPYTRWVDQSANLVHTGLVCDQFAALMADRGLPFRLHECRRHAEKVADQAATSESFSKLLRALPGLDLQVLRLASTFKAQDDPEIRTVLRDIREIFERTAADRTPTTGAALSVDR
jgi:hypothetical protein